jgi:FixJ family two-component response regulator
MIGSPSLVFLVDDDAPVRRSLERLLRSAGWSVEAFPSALQFLASGRHVSATACLVLDVLMPDLDGLELQRELKRADAALPIVFISGHGDIPTSVKAMKAGAVDFLAKPVHADVLFAAVERALARAVAERALRDELESIRTLARHLTPREHQVMELVVTGRLNKQIADELGASEKTIKIHRARVMEKMEARSLPELVRLASRLGVPEAADFWPRS